MPENLVEVTGEDAQFLEENDLDPSELLADAIEDKRDEYDYNNPTPEVPDEVFEKLTEIHKYATEGLDEGLGAFSENFIHGRVSIRSTTTPDGYIVAVNVNQTETLPDTEIGDTLTESGDFLDEIAIPIREHLADLRDTDVENVTFDCELHTPPNVKYESGVAGYEYHARVN